MKQTLIRSASLAFLLSLGAGLAQAHHGWNSYDAPLDMDVKITQVDWGNPHDRLTAIADDGGEWDILLAPPTRNRRFGFGEDTVSVGQTVRLRGERHPDRNEGKIHQIWIGEDMVYEYLYGRGTREESTTSYERLGQAIPTEAPK